MTINDGLQWLYDRSCSSRRMHKNASEATRSNAHNFDGARHGADLYLFLVHGIPGLHGDHRRLSWKGSKFALSKSFGSPAPAEHKNHRCVRECVCVAWRLRNLQVTTHNCRVPWRARNYQPMSNPAPLHSSPSSCTGKGTRLPHGPLQPHKGTP